MLFIFPTFEQTLLTNCPPSVIRSLQSSESADRDNPSCQCSRFWTAVASLLFAFSYIITSLCHTHIHTRVPTLAQITTDCILLLVSSVPLKNISSGINYA